MSSISFCLRGLASLREAADCARFIKASKTDDLSGRQCRQVTPSATRLLDGMSGETTAILASEGPAKRPLFRPRRVNRPLVAARQCIQHAIDDDFAIVAIGHDHRALP